MKCKGILAFSITLIFSLLFINFGNCLHQYRQATFLRAAWLGDVRMMKILHAAGANVNESSATYINPLVAASESGNVDAVNFLLDHGARINQKDEHGWTALMYATGAGQAESVQVLLENGADANAIGRSGSALSIAIRTKRPEIIKILSEIEADR